MNTLSFFAHTFHAMGSPCSVLAWARNEREARAWFTIAQTETLRLHKKYSRYDPQSALSQLNARAGGRGRIAVDEETAALFNFAGELHRLSDSRFDVTSGVLRRIWNFKSEKPRVPTAHEIADCLQCVGWRKLDWDGAHLTLPNTMELDLGGIVKEYAADRAATLCAASGARHLLVNLGGDLRAVDAQPNAQPWHIGIRHPRQEGKAIATLELFTGGLATSGDYERFFEMDGKRYCHILDATTGAPAQCAQSVSVLAPSCMVAGGVSTLAMLAGAGGRDVLAKSGFSSLHISRDGSIQN